MGCLLLQLKLEATHKRHDSGNGYKLPQSYELPPALAGGLSESPNSCALAQCFPDNEWTLYFAGAQAEREEAGARIRWPPSRASRGDHRHLRVCETGLLLQSGFERLNHFLAFGRLFRARTSDDFPVPVDQELVEIPRYVPAEFRIGLLVREKLEDRSVSSPLTETFENIGKVTLYFVEQKVLISSSVPGSWPPKLFAGTPSTTICR